MSQKHPYIHASLGLFLKLTGAFTKLPLLWETALSRLTSLFLLTFILSVIRSIQPCLSSYPSLVFLNDSSVVSLLAFNFSVVWAGTLLLWFNFIASSPKGLRSPVMFLQHSWLPGDSVSYSRLLKMYLKIYEPHSTMTYPKIIWFKAKSLFLLYTF